MTERQTNEHLLTAPPSGTGSSSAQPLVESSSSSLLQQLLLPWARWCCFGQHPRAASACLVWTVSSHTHKHARATNRWRQGVVKCTSLNSFNRASSSVVGQSTTVCSQSHALLWPRPLDWLLPGHQSATQQVCVKSWLLNIRAVYKRISFNHLLQRGCIIDDLLWS